MRAFKSSGMTLVSPAFGIICGRFSRKVGYTDLEIGCKHNSGSVAERLNAPVLKTGVEKSIVSSNLTGPAKKPLIRKDLRYFIAIQNELHISVRTPNSWEKGRITDMVYCHAAGRPSVINTFDT